MSFETTPDGRKAIRIKIRGCEDGFTRAFVSLPGGDEMVIVTVHSLPHEASPEVQQKFIALAASILNQLISDAVGQPVAFEELQVTAPGAPVGAAKH